MRWSMPWPTARPTAPSPLMTEHLHRIENQLDLHQNEEQPVDLRRILGAPAGGG